MAANYWSSHASLSLTLAASSHSADLARGISPLQLRQLKAHFISHIWKLATRSRLRYRVAATASIYFWRFYQRNSFGSSPLHDPRLLHVGCLYLASKSEENIVNAKNLAACARSLMPGWPYDTQQILDVEMMIVSELDFHLLTHHPYRSLLLYATDSGMPNDMVACCWAAINDLYRCDAVLAHPPHMLALGCMAYAWAQRTKEMGQGQNTWDLSAWLQDLNTDLDVVFRVSQSLARLYEETQQRMSDGQCQRLLDVTSLPLPQPPS